MWALPTALYPGAPPIRYRSGVSQLPNPLTGLYRDSIVNGEAGDCLFTSQADYMPLLGSGNGDIMDWDYLDADEDADINLF
jgi:hypothetical protein